MENLLNVNQAAFILKVHPLTIRRYINEGKLKAIRAGGNVRIRETDLNDFNKDFTGKEKATISSPFRKMAAAKQFSVNDPLLRLEGRGAKIKLSV